MDRGRCARRGAVGAARSPHFAGSTLFGDRDGDGFVEYERRTSRGLENQSWKDSGDSQRFRDGSLAKARRSPRSRSRATSSMRSAGSAELARERWRRCPSSPTRLELEAGALGERFDDALLDGGATGLTPSRSIATSVRSTRSARTSVTFSGAGSSPTTGGASVAGHLMSRRMWSGWGIRTMAADEVAYNPISYHNGTVWPHDTSLVAWGLGDAGMTADVPTRSAGAFSTPPSRSRTRFPRSSPGSTGRATPFAVAYPTASRPQAWAAGAPILCLQLLLGLRPDPAADALTSIIRRGTLVARRPYADRRPRARAALEGDG